MNDGANTRENLELIFEKLEKFLKTETVVGEPVIIGEITIVPLINVVFGLGAGGGSGDVKDAKGSSGVGGGAGTSAKISPTAILVIKDGKTELLPISKSAGLEKLIDMVPGIVEKIQENKKKDEEKPVEKPTE